MENNRKKSSKPKMTRDTVPGNFTLGLAAVDAVPVLFFGINTILIGLRLCSILFVAGAVVCVLSGAIKVLWKVLVVLMKKNVWPMFLQMRIAMPIGFVLLIAGIVTAIAGGSLIPGDLWHSVSAMPSVIFFVPGVLSFVLMGIFGAVLDSSDLKSNWIEQLTNGIGQICFFIGIIFMQMPN